LSNAAPLFGSLIDATETQVSGRNSSERIDCGDEQKGGPHSPARVAGRLTHWLPGAGELTSPFFFP